VDGLFEEAPKQQSAERRVTTIEAKDELVEVGLEVVGDGDRNRSYSPLGGAEAVRVAAWVSDMACSPSRPKPDTSGTASPEVAQRGHIHII
jgi:hypothetical protein